MSKYHAKRSGAYASKKEAKRAGELQLLEKIGAITDLQEQVKFVLVPAQDGERSVGYVADFQYMENGELVIEDCKGFRTREYVIKRKLMSFMHGIKVRET